MIYDTGSRVLKSSYFRGNWKSQNQA